MAKAASEQERAAAVELVREHGLAEAARITGRSKAALSEWAKAAGAPTFVPENVRNAIEGRRLSLEHRRQALASGLLDDAEELRARLFAPSLSSHWDKDGGHHTAELPEPSARDKQSLVTSVAILVDKLQLLTGQATERREMVSVDALDREIAELRQEMDKADV